VNVTAETLQALIVAPGKRAKLHERDPAWDGGREFAHLSRAERHEQAQATLAAGVAQLAAAQELLWASDSYALLIVLQAMDAGGKDGTIRHVMSGVNPQGVRVVSFKQPSTEELDHDFLWRVARSLPPRGAIGILNRSHYEEVVAVRVHREWLERQHLPPGAGGKRLWRQRFDSINAFERHLDRNGTKLVKLFLHVSKQEQRARLLARLQDRDKEWKFSASDLAERERWDDYMEAYEEALSATSTAWAPWHVIPADGKPLMRALVSEVILAAISSLNLKWPQVSEQQRVANEQARRALEAEH
jgi:PPK2 family polyphosphate:nucleotide phosphotransferase